MVFTGDASGQFSGFSVLLAVVSWNSSYSWVVSGACRGVGSAGRVELLLRILLLLLWFIGGVVCCENGDENRPVSLVAAGCRASPVVVLTVRKFSRYAPAALDRKSLLRRQTKHTLVDGKDGPPSRKTRILLLTNGDCCLLRSGCNVYK